MEIIGPILEIVKAAWSPIGRRIGYITNLNKNMANLDKNAQILLAQRDDHVKAMMTREPRTMVARENELWLKGVEQIELNVKIAQEEYGRHPNVYSRMKLGKRVRDVIEEVTDLSNKRPKLQGNEFSNPPLERVVPQIVEINSSTDSEPRLQKILGLLKDAKIRKIGIWGKGGIGKTRILKLLNNRPEVSSTFEIIIWVTVSGEGSRKKMQNDIAKRLNCVTADMSDDQLKAFIHNNLSRKKFLLILDDIWERIDLDEVGIPIVNQDNGCKIILTTRRFHVCQHMGTDEDVQIEKLSEHEAWSLFTENVGEVAMSPHIEPIAKEIVRKCGGLPLAIIVIGSSLRKNYYVAVWRNTLRKLQLPSTTKIEGFDKDLFSILRISYDRLLNDCERNLFLYCSLYPEDHYILITELVEYCWLEGYIQGVDSIEEARDDGYHMVINLVYASLLEKCGDEKYVKMHDIIRDFALKEASGFLAKTGEHVKHPPEEKDWLQAQKISLMGCSFRNLLLERPNCGNLTTLLLQNNEQLTTIPDSFFEYMHSLHILDLSMTTIKSLPSSSWNLVNLRGLYLRGCKNLKELPSQVGALKALEVLHLGGIRYLPREVGELTGLKRLKIRFENHSCFQIDEDTRERKMKLRVPTGIFPNLPKMEELSLHVPPFEQDCLPFSLSDCVEKEQWDDESMEVVVDELCSLEHLTHVDVYFPKVESLERFLRHGKSVKASWFKSFRFRVGTERALIYPYEMYFTNWDRYLLYKGGVGMSHATITETLAHCSFFLLQDHQTARNLLEFGPANMNELEGCRVIGCDKMETLFDRDGEEQTCALLPNLKHLLIWGLPNLRSLCVGRLFNGTLSKLTTLQLFDCRKLKSVFQLSIIRQLDSLKSLWVSNCSMVEEIIEVEEEMSVASNDKVILPNIQCIELWFLPELVSICRGFSNFEWPSLETIEISRCHKLKSLSFLSHGTDIVAPALEEIRGENEWWEALEWEDSDIKQQLQPFFRQFGYYYASASYH